MVPELIGHGKIIRPGLALSLASDQLAKRLGIEGVLILDVASSSKASEAGLRPTRRTRYGEVILGDVVAIGETTVTSTNDLLLALEDYEVGDRVSLVVIRDQQRATIDVELEATE